MYSAMRRFSEHNWVNFDKCTYRKRFHGLRKWNPFPSCVNNHCWDFYPHRWVLPALEHCISAITMYFSVSGFFCFLYSFLDSSMLSYISYKGSLLFYSWVAFHPMATPQFVSWPSEGQSGLVWLFEYSWYRHVFMYHGKVPRSGIVA